MRLFWLSLVLCCFIYRWVTRCWWFWKEMGCYRPRPARSVGLMVKRANQELASCIQLSTLIRTYEKLNKLFRYLRLLIFRECNFTQKFKIQESNQSNRLALRFQFSSTLSFGVFFFWELACCWCYFIILFAKKNLLCREDV